jgi:hypothetical protein
MPQGRSDRGFPWFGDVSAVGRVGKAGAALVLLGVLAGCAAMLSWPTDGPGGAHPDFATLEQRLVVPNALLLGGLSALALGSVLYLVGYAVALVRWVRSRSGVPSGGPPEGG